MTNEEIWDQVALLESRMTKPDMTSQMRHSLRLQVDELKAKTTDLRLPVEWQEFEGIEIMDHDGWDRTNFEESWNTPIDYREFCSRVSSCTIRIKPYAERTLW